VNAAQQPLQSERESGFPPFTQKGFPGFTCVRPFGTAHSRCQVSHGLDPDSSHTPSQGCGIFGVLAEDFSRAPVK
jgi:hypothetical protein